tara:strand:- start:157 stop:444 length:288 start_codon:yes stop_codon:yes gene_type:complete
MWFWAISAIAGSILGSATDSWFRDTKLGVWFYAKMDSLYSWAAERYGIKLITDEQKQMAKFPELAKRLDSLEARIRLLERTESVKRAESNYQDSF